MKYGRQIWYAMASWLCIVGMAGAQETAFTQPGQAAQTSGGLVGGVDVLFLKVYGGDFDQMMHQYLVPDPAVPGNDYEMSPRVWLGYVGQSGFGIRGRWFQYQHDLKAGTGVFDEVVGRNYLDVYAVDVEFTQQVGLGCWNLNAGAGLRAGGVTRQATLEELGQTPDAVTSRFEGIGPTLFAELKRPIMGTGFSLIANGRGSLLFGDSTATWTGSEVGPSKFDVVATVAEIQLGVEYARQLGYGATGFVQGLWEGQLWANCSSVPNFPDVRRDDLGLTGVALNFGITR